jgi:hypothetical protein
MRKSLAILFACTVLLGSGVTVAPASASAQSGATLAPASARAHHCVSRGEYRHAHKGMTKARVHRSFDTAGKRKAISHSGGGTSEVRSYAACHRHGRVMVSYTTYYRHAPLRLNNKVRSH